MTAGTAIDTGRADPTDAQGGKNKKAKSPIGGAIRKGEKARSNKPRGDKAAVRKILTDNGITGKQLDNLTKELGKHPGLVKGHKVGKVDKNVPQLHVRRNGTLEANESAYQYLYDAGCEASFGDLYEQAYNTIPLVRGARAIGMFAPAIVAGAAPLALLGTGLTGAAIGASNAAAVAGAVTLAVLSGGVVGGVVGATIGITIVIAAV